MKSRDDGSPAAWTAAELEADRKRWTFALDDRARRDLLAALKKARDPNKTLLDYRREDFDIGTGRGYNSNAELDFHTDSADMVALSCYNKARAGGMSITPGTPTAHARMKQDHPDPLEWLHRPVHFSRQGEQAPVEAPSYPHPIFDEHGGKPFSKWNWNRVTSAQKLEDVPKIPAEHKRALDTFDQVVRRPDLAHAMWLEPGDLQIINSHVTLHSRTDFTDHDDPAKKRLLFRLWLAPPDGDHPPESWRVLYKSC